MADLRIKRAYRAARKFDGQRILVDRLWPRGVAKDGLRLADWAKELAPSDELRQWFGHNPEKWAEFQKRYAEELDGKSPFSLLAITSGRSIMASVIVLSFVVVGR